MVEERNCPTPTSGLELTPEEMRRLGYRVIDLIVDRWEGLGEGPAWGGATRKELEPILWRPPPEEGMDPEDVLQEVVREVLPRAGRIDHPRFFAFIPSSPTWPSVMGDMLATGFNVFAGTWLESAGPSQLELVVVDWFRSWIGLPETGGGVLTSGGSVANLVALVTAREWARSPEDPVIYMSDQGHSSLERAAHIAGISPGNLRRIPTDTAFRMDLEALEAAIRRDRSRGMHPLCLCGNAGATNTGAIDPLDRMADVRGWRGPTA
jgi:glutamate/tyrosine decarboxylase-like PLP-dependent enzyme